MKTFLNLHRYSIHEVGRLHDNGLITDDEFNIEAERRGYFFIS